MRAEERISIDPKVLAGKPVIRDTRLPVHLVLEMLSAGVTEAEIIQEYPQLVVEDIHAAIRFASHVLKQSEWAEYGVA